MKIEKMSSTLMNRLNITTCRQDIWVASKMLDMYGIDDIRSLYNKSIKDGFSKSIQQLIALSFGMSNNTIIQESELLDSVKEVYPVLLTCVTYEYLSESKGMKKEDCLTYMERNCIEIPTPYLVVLKRIIG